MRHVFVETNFLVELLRPIPLAAAEKLIERHDRAEIVLHLPWCCASEALRTLNQRIIGDELGFTDRLVKFVQRAVALGHPNVSAAD